MTHPLRLLFRLLDRSRRLLAVAVVLAVAQSVVLAPIGLIVRRVFDVSIPEGRIGAVAGFGALIVGLYAASALLSYWTRIAALRATTRAVASLRTALIERLYGLRRAYFDRTDLGTLHSTVVQDSQRVDSMGNLLISQVLPAAVVGSVLTLVLILLNWFLFAVLVASVVPVLLVLSPWLKHSVRVRARVWQRAEDAFSALTQSALRGISETKVRAAEQPELERHRQTHEQLGEATYAKARAQMAYTRATGVVLAAGAAILLVIGGREVASGHMTTGDLLAFFAVVGLLRGQVVGILSATPYVVAGIESLRRLQQILETEEPEPYRGSRLLEFQGAMALEGVTFAYGETPLFNDVDLRVEPGEFLAVVGPNGAGKSTLISLLLGLYRPHQGRVLADGVQLDDLDLTRLRGRIGVLLQDPVIFPGSIAENVAYGRPGATPDQIRAAAAAASAAEFVERLPRGYETHVGDDGHLLSGGERQRLALARAMLGAPSALILDEPTSHLDAVAVDALLSRLRATEATVLVISHDLAVASHADRSYVLRDGRLFPFQDTAPALHASSGRL